MVDRMKQEACVILQVEDWAKVIAAVAKSPFLSLIEKEHINSTLYDCLIEQDRVVKK